MDAERHKETIPTEIFGPALKMASIEYNHQVMKYSVVGLIFGPGVFAMSASMAAVLNKHRLEILKELEVYGLRNYVFEQSTIHEIAKSLNKVSWTTYTSQQPKATKTKKYS